MSGQLYGNKFLEMFTLSQGMNGHFDCAEVPFPEVSLHRVESNSVAQFNFPGIMNYEEIKISLVGTSHSRTIYYEE